MSSTNPPTPKSAKSEAQKPQHGTFRSLWRLYPFVKPQAGRLIGGFVAAIGASLLALAIPLVLEELIEGPIADKNIQAVIWGAAFVLLLGLGEAVMVWARRWLILGPSTRVEYQMRMTFFDRLLKLPVAFHDRWQSGQLLSRMMQDLSLIRRWLAFGLTMLLVNIITVVIGAVFLFRWHWLLGTVFLAVSLPLWYAGYSFEKRYGALSRLSQDQTGDLATAVEESVHGIRVLKAFGRGSHALTSFAGQARALRKTEMSKAKSIGLVDFWLVLLPNVAFALCLFSGIYLASLGQINGAELFAFFAMAMVLRWPLESIGFFFSFLLDARTATDRVFEVYDSQITISDPLAPQSPATHGGELSFKDVHFRYPDAPSHEPDLLNGIDLTLKPGETMALVGLTGSGKTTLTTLPARLYDVNSGTVTVDGIDVRELTLNDLRTRVGMAFEDATLFSATVRTNVLLGRDDLDPNSAEAEAILREALAVAQADFVYDLPQRLETKIGEEGMSLSGGQRQRLALARAVAARPEVLVLDDPLSALDVDTEALVEDALRRVLRGTTALIVAHRPSTVALADRVALLENGKITAVGKHADLLKSSEHYRFVISSWELEEAASGERANLNWKQQEAADAATEAVAQSPEGGDN